MNEPVDRVAAYRILSEALECETGERDALVAARCKGEPALERHVRSLLALAATDGGTGLLVAGIAPPVPERIGREYGHFRLLELLGVGGMGAVYRAERTDGVPQVVAVKVLRDSLSDADSTRFAREARILAGLEHPSIARLIDVGVREGEGWIAMEYVRGQAITAWCDAAALDMRSRVRLLVAVADAIATAHRRLIVHRDIKPSNVLVDAEGNPKLIDFGIAYALQDPGAPREATADVSRLFTPHYAAPEQVRGEPVTVATDVFGLGALAYRVLAGCEPFAEATSAVGYLLAVTQQDIRMPSEAGRGAGLAPGGVRALQGDLDSILMKALDRDPARRYAGMDDMRADLNAWLEGRPVGARAATWHYRFAKFARRRALPLAIASLAAIGLAVAGVVYVLQERRVTQALQAAARRGDFLQQLLKSADPSSGRRDVTVAELVDSARQSLDGTLGQEPLVEASMLGLIAETDGNLGRYEQALAASSRELELLAANGGSPLERARALVRRGELFRGFGRYAQGEAPLREALALYQRLSGVESDRAAALNELGMVLTNTGNEAGAVALYRQALEIDRKSGDRWPAESVVRQNNFAVLLNRMGRYRESADLARQALARGRKVLPADHSDLLSLEQTYAMTLDSLGEHVDAEATLRDLLARSTRVRGPEHPDTLVAKVQLGEILIDLGRHAEATELLEQAAKGLERAQGPTSPYAASAWSDYSVAACGGDDAAAGLAAAQRVAVIRAAALPATDWHRKSTQADIGYCLERLHRYREAEPILVGAAHDLEAIRGPGFYTTQLAYKGLRELYAQTGRPVDAARMAALIKP